MNLEELEAFETFLYPETKDLLMAFLTLLTSVFSISILFSEKFVGPHSSKIDQVILFATWGLFFLAILLGGSALHQLHIAGSCAHMPSCEKASVVLGIHNALLRGEFAGILFACGLLGLASAAFRRVKREAIPDRNP